MMGWSPGNILASLEAVVQFRVLDVSDNKFRSEASHLSHRQNHTKARPPPPHPNRKTANQTHTPSPSLQNNHPPPPPKQQTSETKSRGTNKNKTTHLSPPLTGENPFCFVLGLRASTSAARRQGHGHRWPWRCGTPS